MTGPLRVTLVHERFTDFTGSEKVVEQLAVAWPDAPVLAPVVLDSVLPPELRGRVHGGPLSRLATAKGGYAHLLPLLPGAMRRLPVGSPDVVIASHHAFATQVVHATDAPVVAYVHSPARWVWEPAFRVGEAGGAVGAAGLATFAALFRGADRAAAARVHTLVGNSTAVAGRIRAWWDREAEVVHPPVDTEFYTPDLQQPREDFLLLAGRMVPYKKPQLAVLAAQRAGLRLIVTGDGRSRAECEQLAGPGTTFLGRVDEQTQRDLFRRCAAVLMPGEEDFGIVPVEAQACGAPVIAAGVGGALDSVLPGLTGLLVPPPGGSADGSGAGSGAGSGPGSAQSAGQDTAEIERWAGVLRGFRAGDYDPVAVRLHAEGFSREVFRDRMRAVVTAATS